MSTATPARSRPTKAQQRGVTLFGLLFWALLVGFIAYVLVRVLPTLNEYYTVQRAIERVAAANPPTVPEARKAFESKRTSNTPSSPSRAKTSKSQKKTKKW